MAAKKTKRPWSVTRIRILSWIGKGKPSSWIANKLNVKTQTVAAVRAHETMGRYIA